MAIEYRIAQSNDLETIYQFAETQLKVEVPNDMERMMKIWESRFRKEALEHYLKLGWSFIAYDKQSLEICGYFLGQPLLFFEGQTQTLWIEDLKSSDQSISADLIEIAYKLSRDKHFQKVIMPESCSELLKQKNIKYQNQADQWIWCKTTK